MKIDRMQVSIKELCNGYEEKGIDFVRYTD